MIHGSGNKIREARQVSGFDRIELSGVGKLFVTQGDRESLSIEGDDNIVPKIRTVVSDGKLIIGLENNEGINPKTPLVFDVEVRELRALYLAGAGNIEANDIRSSNFEASLSGAGNIALGNLVADSLNAVLSGAGDLVASGTVGSQEVNISGAGSYRAGDLQSRNTSVVTSGVGSATVRASDNLSAVVSGVGSIRYSGSPAVRATRSGIGSITKIGD